MARRQIEVDGVVWQVLPSGRVSSYQRDEFGIVFEHGAGAERVRRVSRFRPLGAQRRDTALGQVSDAQLMDLFRTSQPAWTSPELSYSPRNS